MDLLYTDQAQADLRYQLTGVSVQQLEWSRVYGSCEWWIES